MLLDDILRILKSNSKKIAYRIGENSYTYKQLYKYVCNLYNYILENNKDKAPIVIFGGKEVYMKTAFLACSYAGIPYVPIDENIPIDRVYNIIDQIKPNFVIGNIKTDVKNLDTNSIYKIIEKEEYKDINKIYMMPDDTYYIIFTSGTTGNPKGVEVTYSNLDSCINWLENITKAKNEVILNQANFSFDLSVADLYLSLVSESEHFIINTKSMIDFRTIFKELKMSHSTMAVLTPSFADLLLTDKMFSEELLPELKTIIFCGEKLLNSTVDEIYYRFNNLKIINTYGPTECTFAVTSIEIPKGYNAEIPAGKPKEDVKILIINEDGKVVENGKIGEILIMGKSVAKGYTNKKTDKFRTINGENAYLTGDIGYIKNEMLYVLGRKDSQIKFKGYRIELKDIEQNIMNLGDIEKVKVLPKENELGKIISIIAFIKTKNKTEFEIKEGLKKKLPSYMMPKIKIIKEFPINKNGKCDEKKLIEEY